MLFVYKIPSRDNLSLLALQFKLFMYANLSIAVIAEMRMLFKQTNNISIKIASRQDYRESNDKWASVLTIYIERLWVKQIGSSIH